MGRSETVTMTMNKELFPEYTIYDHISIGGWDFDVSMTVRKKFGLASAIQGARVIFLELRQSGEVVACFDDGKWVIKLADENDEATLALAYFLEKHNKKRPKKEERNMWVHEY